MLDLSWRLLEGSFSVLINLPIVLLIYAILIFVSCIGVIFLPIIVFIICEKLSGKSLGTFPEILTWALQFIWTISCVMFMVEEITK